MAKQTVSVLYRDFKFIYEFHLVPFINFRQLAADCWLTRRNDIKANDNELYFRSLEQGFWQTI
jgi:hypothetical protein